MPSIRNYILCLFLSSTFSVQADLPVENVFTDIYHQDIWGVDEYGNGTSGNGSSLTNTELYIMYLQHFIINHNITSVVDAGCGDWTFSRNINWGEINYLGIDTVKHVVERNQQLFQKPNIHFVYDNILEYDLPGADLLLCKDVLQHLSNDDIQHFIQQLPKFKHALITNDVDPVTLSSTNPDIARGGWRFLDLTKPPFSIRGTKVFRYKTIVGTEIKEVLHIHNE